VDLNLALTFVAGTVGSLLVLVSFQQRTVTFDALRLLQHVQVLRGFEGEETSNVPEYLGTTVHISSLVQPSSICDIPCSGDVNKRSVYQSINTLTCTSVSLSLFSTSDLTNFAFRNLDF